MRSLLLLALAACAPERPEGSCVFWADCGEGGACEYTARIGDEPRFECSFADASCESGRRFGELATTERANQCVEFAPVFGGICDDTHECGEGVDCRLGRCVNVADLDATAEVFAARCSRHLRAGGDAYLWGFALEISEAPLSISVFLDAAPQTAGNLAAPAPPPILNSSQISMGANHLCSLGTLEDSTPYSYCIGLDSNPAAGFDPDGGPVFPLAKDNPFGAHLQIAAGTTHTCGLVDSKIVHCWGLNDAKQIDGTANPGSDPDGPGPLPSGYHEAEVTLPHRTGSIAAGKNFTCAGTAAGVYCWGGADNWAMGTFEFPDGRADAVQAIPANPATVVDAGEAHACAIVDDLLWCWGVNELGQVNGIAVSNKQLPVQPLGDTPVINVAVGRLHTCAVTAEHAVICWGNNGVGQLGSDTTSTAPQVVPLEARAVGPIAASDNATCALLEDALVHCWGQPDLTTAYNPPVDRIPLCGL